RAVARLRSFVDHMLSAAAIQAGTLHIEPARVDVRALVEGVSQYSAALLDGRQQRLDCRLPDEPVTIMADRVHAARALLNLVSNASKYGPPGGAIALCARAEATKVRIAVIDHGRGIAPDRQAELFERFYRAGREHNGVGLGLSIVKGIVEAHGGEVGVSSIPDVETTFWLTLPLAGPDEVGA
ncbi:MAG: sensor histidine kinase, partial [Chloroflexota bacterium]